HALPTRRSSDLVHIGHPARPRVVDWVVLGVPGVVVPLEVLGVHERPHLGLGVLTDRRHGGGEDSLCILEHLCLLAPYGDYTHSLPHKSSPSGRRRHDKVPTLGKSWG